MDERLRQRRLLGRATFGARPGDAERLRGLGAEAWLEAELAAPPVGPALAKRLERFPALAFGPADWMAGSDLPEPAAGGKPGPDGLRALLRLRRRALETARDAAGARLVRAVHGGGLHDVMVDFWSSHFSVDARKGIVGGLLPHLQRAVLDRHALGRFEDLLLAATRSPAMLFYLDNWSSTAPPRGVLGARLGRRRGLNENHARELLELHTLGVDGGYTQDDVIATARALTGWSLESRRHPAYRFHARLHDDGEKTVLGERLRGTGEEEGVSLLRRLARHPATADHVSRKLARRFVADAPPPALVARAARVFLESDGDMPSVLRSLLLAPELADPAHRKLRTPLRLFAASVRATGGQCDGGEPLLRALAPLGELPFFARTPAGHPEHAARWIDPAALLERMRLAFALARGGVPGARLGREGVAADDDGAALPPESLALALAAPETQWC